MARPIIECLVCKKFFRQIQTTVGQTCGYCRSRRLRNESIRKVADNGVIVDSLPEEVDPLRQYRINALQARGLLQLPMFRPTAREKKLKDQLERDQTMSFTPEEVQMLLATTAGAAATLLASECPLRVTALEHLAGHYVHYLHPQTQRVCCYHEKSEQPEGWDHTVHQANLFRAMDVSSSREYEARGTRGTGTRTGKVVHQGNELDSEQPPEQSNNSEN